jgi:hypothetical protein
VFISPGMDFEEYVVVQRVALGATSEVFKAQHRDNGKLAALKVLHADWCLDPEVVARFFNEALALQRLDHPHIVKVLDCRALPNGRPFMILEWLPSDLYRVLACAKGALAVQVGTRIALQLARALCVVHCYLFCRATGLGRRRSMPFMSRRGNARPSEHGSTCLLSNGPTRKPSISRPTSIRSACCCFKCSPGDYHLSPNSRKIGCITTSLKHRRWDCSRGECRHRCASWLAGC